MTDYVIEFKKELKLHSQELKNQKKMLYYFGFILFTYTIINTFNYLIDLNK
jgi:hypothetical protein